MVAFSSGRRFNLLLHDFGCDTVFIADRSMRYYLRQAPAIARSILAVADRHGHRRVLFIGTSKGGFGALMMAGLCASMRSDRVFHVAAFNPQTQLHPPNANLTFKSYRTLKAAARSSKELGKNLKRYGDASVVGKSPRVAALVVYARDARADRIEARRMRGVNVTFKEVAGATHGTLFHFMSKGKSRKALIATLMRVYGKEGDDDLAQTRPADLGAAADEILASAAKEPELNELLLAHLDTAPVNDSWASGIWAGLSPRLHRARAWLTTRKNSRSTSPPHS